MPTLPDPFLPRRVIGAPDSSAPAPAPERTQYTGSFNETNQAPQYGPQQPSAPQTQLASYNGTYGPGAAMSNYLSPSSPQTASYGEHLTPQAVGSPFDQMRNTADYYANRMREGATAALGHAAPQINTDATNMFAQGTGNALGNANATNLYGIQAAQTADRTNLYGMRQGLDMSALANGQGAQGQFGAADRLMGFSQMPAGPSVAEQQLRMGGDQAMRQQMAMAAGARGGNAALALQNAGQNQGDIMGNLNGQLGIQRAQEDMANRQFAANAAQAAGNTYGQAAGTQMNAMGGAANIFGGVANNQLGQGQIYGGIANNQLGQANTNLGLTNTYAGLAAQQAGFQGQQNELNDRTNLAREALGYGIQNDERNAELQQGALDTQRYGIDRNVAVQLQLQQNKQNNDLWQKILGGSIMAAGAVAAPFTGGASLAAEPYGAKELMGQ